MYGAHKSKNVAVVSYESNVMDGYVTTEFRGFVQMPDSIEELEDAIADCEAQAAAVICNNENAILIYEQRCEEVRTLNKSLPENPTAAKCFRGGRDVHLSRSLWNGVVLTRPPE